LRNYSRRRFLRRAAWTAVASPFLSAPTLGQSPPRVVVIGGGFAGATAARTLKQMEPRIDVALVESDRTFTACPFSNLVICGLRDLRLQQFGYDKIAAAGVLVAFATATRVDAQARSVGLDSGSTLTYDRLLVAPGIDIRWDALPGYNQAAAEQMPHAWKAGIETLLLRRQLEAMEDGGVVIISTPPYPYRCPTGPYERASLIANYLQTKKPRSKVIVLDANDAFPKQRLFENAWKELYPDHLERLGLSNDGRVTSIEAAERTLVTDFAKHRAAVANVIPPQKAGRIAEIAGITDATGWCPIDPTTFESSLVPNIHVLGDATIAGAMPKSAFSANAQAKVCAAAVVRLLAGHPPSQPKLINACYSIVGPNYGISVAGVYQPVNGVLTDVQGAGGASPLDAPRSTRAQEAMLADGWFDTITTEVFG
jgi:sulfide dehydrogenase [flavocytochrome c] flavoprotein subunit